MSYVKISFKARSPRQPISFALPFFSHTPSAVFLIASYRFPKGQGTEFDVIVVERGTDETKILRKKEKKGWLSVEGREECVCVCARTQSLFDVPSIFQTDCGEIPLH